MSEWKGVSREAEDAWEGIWDGAAPAELRQLLRRAQAHAVRHGAELGWYGEDEVPRMRRVAAAIERGEVEM